MSILEVRDLVVRYGHGRGATQAVDGVSFSVGESRVLGLVGESGSGKSTIARAVMGLTPITSGLVTIAGRPATGSSRRERIARALDMQLVFQDPYSSLDPRMTVRQTIGEALRLRGRMPSAAFRAEVERLLDLVNLESSYANRLPREMSGGQRQRVAIARALAVRPRLIIADEVTSALDVSVQAVILNLLREVQRNEGLSMLFISHNLTTVRYLSDEVAVMRRGRIVESGPVDQVVNAPREAYTRELLAAAPVLRATAGDELSDPTTSIA